MTNIPTNLVPQIRSIRDIRNVLKALQIGKTKREEIANVSGVLERQVNYAISASKSLNWLSMRKELTPLGERFLQTGDDSQEEAQIVKDSIEGSPVLGALAPQLLATAPIESKQLAQQISKKTGLGIATAQHRAGCLLSWRSMLEEKGLIGGNQRRDLPESTPDSPSELRTKKAEKTSNTAKKSTKGVHESNVTDSSITMTHSRTPPVNIIRLVLEQEEHPIRFETFCCDLLSEVEGTTVLPTSKSWDRGRDGRSAGRGPRICVCATLESRLDTKSLRDLKKLASSTRRIEKIYYCTNKNDSEHTLENACSKIAHLFPDTQIDPLDVRQIARFCLDYPTPLAKQYPGEIRSIQDTLTVDGTSDERKKEATLLALATAAGNDSAAIRSESYKNLILHALSENPYQTINEISNSIAKRLKLGRSLPHHVFDKELIELKDDGMIIEDARGKHSATPSASERLADSETDAAAQMLMGRQLVKASIDEAIGTELAIDQFDRVWKAIQNKITHFFYSSGHKMLTTISRFMEANGKDNELLDIPFFVDDLAATAATAASSLDEQREDIKEAFRDIFKERCSPAYDWLSRLCASFVIACTLGIEANSGTQIRDAIASMQLVLDTDILLEYLGSGEPGHESAKTLYGEWKRHGGTVLMSQPVLEEIAYHAWIAENDYKMVPHSLILKNIDRRRYSKNVFVRSFGHMRENKKAKSHHWVSYIGEFQGRSENDVTNIREYLEDIGMMMIPDVGMETKSWKRIHNELRHGVLDAQMDESEQKRMHDKARRDARLFCAICQRNESLRSSNSVQTSVLVSSSGRLKRAARQLSDWGLEVLSLSEAVYLLSLIPGVSVGMTALGSMLFDNRLSASPGPLEMLLLRAVRESGDYDMPWARRKRVLRDMRARLVKTAKEQGVDDLRPENVMRSNDPHTAETLTAIIAKSLGSAGAEHRLERELEEANRKIASLEAKLQRSSNSSGDD